MRICSKNMTLTRQLYLQNVMKTRQKWITFDNMDIYAPHVHSYEIFYGITHMLCSLAIIEMLFTFLS